MTPIEEFVIKARDKLKVVVKDFDYKPAESKDRDKLRHDLKSKSDHMNVNLFYKYLRQPSNKPVKKLLVIYISLICI